MFFEKDLYVTSLLRTNANPKCESEQSRFTLIKTNKFLRLNVLIYLNLAV